MIDVSIEERQGKTASADIRTDKIVFSPIYCAPYERYENNCRSWHLTVPYYVIESTDGRHFLKMTMRHVYVFQILKKKKKNVFSLVPCNSSNCHSPCDCKNTGSDECDAPDRVVGAILPVLVAVRAGGALADDDSESDDDVPWCYILCSTKSLKQDPNWQPSQSTSTERTKEAKDFLPWLYIAGTRRQSFLVWTVRYSLHSGRSRAGLAGMCCAVLWRWGRRQHWHSLGNANSGSRAIRIRDTCALFSLDEYRVHAGNSK